VPDSKRCRKCGATKPVDAFGRDRSRPDGRFPWCLECKRAWESARREANIDAERARGRASYARHRERRIAAVAERYRSDPAVRAAHLDAARRYVERHPDRRAASTARYAAANRDYYADAKRRWRAANLDRAREIARNAQRRRKARRMGAAGSCSEAQLRGRWDYYGGLCWLCRAPADTIDHVVALSRGGSEWPANLRPACRSCNSRKHARDWRGVR